MTNRYANYFSFAFLNEDGSVQIGYSTHDYAITKVPTRWQAQRYVEEMNRRNLVCNIISYPEAVAIGI